MIAVEVQRTIEFRDVFYFHEGQIVRVAILHSFADVFAAQFPTEKC